jgi:hypothetical protein
MSTDIAPLDNRPWIPRPFPSWLITELARRKNDLGIDYESNKNSSWDSKGNWNKYKGPMTPWARVCSNGNGINTFLPSYRTGNTEKNFPKKGFVFTTGMGFMDSYGLNQNQTVMGYEVDGTPHIIPMDKVGMFNYTINNSNSGNNGRPTQLYLPPPGIESIEAIIQKQFLRELTIKWSCHGFAQLEYMTPYFLTPKISVIVEYGWNHFNQDSLLDLTNSPHRYEVLQSGSSNLMDFEYISDNGVSTTALTLKELWNDGQPLYDCNMRISRGMYDVAFGIIKNFEFSTSDGIKYECTTTIASKNTTWGGINLHDPDVKNKNIGSSDEVKSQAMSFSDFLEKRLKKIKNCIDKGLNFMSPLDDTEKNLNIFKDTSVSNYFYGGAAENRVFIGRNEVSHTYGGTPADNDWDKSNTDSMWVKMDFLIEVFNFFTTKPSSLNDFDNTTFQFYKLTTGAKTIIGAHPNLISTDGTTMLIPNAQSPKYNNGVLYNHANVFSGSVGIGAIDGQSLSSGKNDKIFLSSYETYQKNWATSSLANNELYATFKTGIYSTAQADIIEVGARGRKVFVKNPDYGFGATNNGVARDNLDALINYYVYNPQVPAHNVKPPQKSNNLEHSFPQYQDDVLTGKKAGYYGYLEDLYINADFVINIVKSATSTEEFFNALLQGINDSVNGFWDLQLISGAPKDMVFVDQKLFPDLAKQPIFQFDVASSRNIVKNIVFTSTISNIQANQIIASSTNNQNGDGEESTSNPQNFVFGDRLFTDIPSNKQSLDIDNGSIISQLQQYGANKDAYFMTFRDINGNKNIVNLVLPNKSLLTSILNDMDLINNVNVYGGQQPNFVLEITLQGIAGLNTFQCFSIKNFPKPYSEEDVIFQIIDVKHSINNENWETTIKAGLRPFGANRSLKGTPKFVDGSEQEYN